MGKYAATLAGCGFLRRFRRANMLIGFGWHDADGKTVRYVNLDIVLKAAEAASGAASASDAALRAASAMPADATDFDRGIAAGMAVARYLRDAEPIQAAA